VIIGCGAGIVLDRYAGIGFDNIIYQ
jgi:hypothetical protein